MKLGIGVRLLAGLLALTCGGVSGAGEEDPVIDGKPLSQLIKQLRSENRGFQLRAARALAEAPTNARPQVIEQVIPVLTSSRENDKFVAAQILGEYGPEAKSAVPDLLPMLEGTQYERNRAAAAKALGQILKDAQPGEEAEKVTQALIKVFNDKYSDVRKEAVRACGMIGQAAKACVPHLTDRLEDNFEPWRESADSLQTIRRAAAWTAGRMGKHSVPLIDQLIGQMHKYQPDCSWEWIYAIGEIGLVHENVMPNLVRRLEKTIYGQWIMGHAEEYPGYVKTLFGVLQKFGPKSAPAVDLLARILEEKIWNPEMQEGALRVLGAIGPAAEKTVSTIEKKGLASKNADVQKAAQEALAGIRGKIGSTVPPPAAKLHLDLPAEPGYNKR